MSQSDWALLAIALVLVVMAGLSAAAESALYSFSKGRAERLVEDGRRGAAKLRRIVDDPPRYLNTALLLRTVFEICAIVLVTVVVFGMFVTTWEPVLLTAAIMIVISYVFWGVAPRTLGRQHSDAVACSVAGSLVAVTTVLGPFPRLLIMIGNALTPGRGFVDGPFSTEAELREMVDLAEASELIESGERQMIHSVFDLGDTIVREVMVPRTDMVFIEEHKTLRQAVSLSLRSGFSRIPVIRDGLDDVVGVLYLKDVIKRVFDVASAETAERVASVMRPPVLCPDSKPVDELLREMQLKRVHLVVVVDEFGGTAGMATIEDILEEIVGEITDEYDEENTDITELGEGRYRVSSRLPVDELGELFGLKLDDEDVDTVGGLMAKVLNRVPIAGSVVKFGGLEMVAERSTGRRNRIGTVVVSAVVDDEHEPDDQRESDNQHSGEDQHGGVEQLRGDGDRHQGHDGRLELGVDDKVMAATQLPTESALRAS
ncbi:MAG TPA: hemolysin family protein [Propionibacteriaceae bacterium]|nr:hemolysin family protein [Propionibacteriaceae bacterium]